MRDYIYTTPTTYIYIELKQEKTRINRKKA